MQFSQPRFLGRYRDRVSIRLKFFVLIALIGALFVLAIYPLLGRIYDSRLDDRIDSRANEIAYFLGPEIGDGSALAGTTDRLVRMEDISSIAVADVETGMILASSSDPATGTQNNDSNPAALQLNALLSGTAGSTPEVANAEFRPIFVGSPLAPASMDRYVMAIELDRMSIAADLEFGKNSALEILIVGVAIMVLAAYFAITSWVSRPLTALARLDSRMLADSPDGTISKVPANELSRVRNAMANLVHERQADSGGNWPSAQIVPDTLPAVSLVLDESLAIVSAHLDDQHGSELEIEHLDDLLSAEIVEHIVATAQLLHQGQFDTFEFALGATVYGAYLAAQDNGYVLQIAEGERETEQMGDPSVAAAEILSDLLTSLPVSVIETDDQGVVQYANRAVFGAESVDEIIGRVIGEVLPEDYAEDGRQAMRQARRMKEPQIFVIPPPEGSDEPGWTNYAVANATEDGISYFILSTETHTAIVREESEAVDTSALEEQLWSLELKVSEYEEEIAGLHAAVEDARTTVERTTLASTSLVDGISPPMNAVVRLTQTLGSGDVPKQARKDVEALWSAVTSLAGVLDSQLDTRFQTSLASSEASKDERFHLATLLDEVAIEAGARNPNISSRISAFVQPSLPKWLYGNELEARATVFQMVDYARLICPERPLILAAMQDTSTGRSIQVRFEVQIPPPVLEDNELAILRGCISGDVDDAGLLDSLSQVMLPDAEGLDIELVTVHEEATVLRYSTNFELAEDLEAEHAWIRGLRTLIIQDAGDESNGIQPALSALGIIGYVVSGEKDLINALHIAEEYSNPYRLVIADVDTQNLETFVGQLFDGDAPVVLVGKKSESAMVGAISAGYNGYIAKPVRQVDLLEVILSTVEPPAIEDRVRAA